MREQSSAARGAEPIRVTRGDVNLDGSQPGLAGRLGLGLGRVCSRVDRVEALPSPYHDGGPGRGPGAGPGGRTGPDSRARWTSRPRAPWPACPGARRSAAGSGRAPRRPAA